MSKVERQDAPPHSSVDLKHRLGLGEGGLELDIAFQLTRPWTVLFGPSGSGKSTILRAVAGLFRPQHARIAVRWRDEDQVATDTKAKIMVPTHKRFIRWAAQRPALFPHMTVRENLRFASEIKNADSNQATDFALERFRLTKIADNRPETLSGGEQQRVSIARAAIAANGRLLLLDEPFTGLDATLRDDLIADLQAWLVLSKTPVLSVTHDVAEAFQLDADVIKIHQGRIVQQGPAAEVLAEERSRLLVQLKADSR